MTFTTIRGDARTRRSRFLVLAIVCGLTLGWAGIAPPARAGVRSGPVAAMPGAIDPDLAAVPPGDWIIRNRETGRCLSSNGNGEVYTVPAVDSQGRLCGYIAHHYWTLDALDRYFNLGTGRCLSSNSNGEVYTVPHPDSQGRYCGHINHHYWYVDGFGRIRNFGTGRCLSSNSIGDVYTVPYQDSQGRYCGYIDNHIWTIG